MLVEFPVRGWGGAAGLAVLLAGPVASRTLAGVAFGLVCVSIGSITVVGLRAALRDC